MVKCVIIPSIAASMLPESITLTFTKLDWNEFVAMLMKCEKVVNYVRHRPTVDLLTSFVRSVETGFEYKINVDDNMLIFMTGLRTRTPTSGADVAVTPNDLLVYLVKPAQ
jgi:hypothetical protein